jgi:luciferase family oxidoreductase group 1
MSTFELPLSVLDVAPVSAGSTAGDALRSSLRLAQHVEHLGYRRFWVAEHHNMASIASSSPAVLLAHIASVTSSIRIGSGGVMLPNHAPLVVAEQFRMLEALHPGRVDLGIGRAPGTDQATARALRRTEAGLNAEEFPQELGDLMAYLKGDSVSGTGAASAGGSVTATPSPDTTPDVWLLGSSGYSAQVAGILGLPFAFAHHFSSANTLPAVELYRAAFTPSEQLSEPYLMIAAMAVAAETDERAQWLAGPAGLAFLRMRMGRRGPLPTPEEAARYPYSEMDRAFIADRQVGQAIGSVATVHDQLSALAAATGANELMLTSMMHDPQDRLHSYELIAENLIAPQLLRQRSDTTPTTVS